MNSLHALSTSNNNNTQHTAQPVSVRRTTAHATVVRDAYDCAVGCVRLFWRHSLCADCLFDYFLPYRIYFSVWKKLCSQLTLTVDFPFTLQVNNPSYFVSPPRCGIIRVGKSLYCKLFGEKQWWFSHFITGEYETGFFFSGGLRGPPIRQKFCQSPPIRHLSPFLDQGLSPPSAEVRP